MLLHRPVFTQHRFASYSLTVLATLVHRFTETGTYQVAVSGRGRTRIDTLTVKEGAAHRQVNIDMAKPGNAPGQLGSQGCCCEPAAGRELAPGGVVAFYASTGTGSYEVTITQLGEREKRVVLSSAESLPAGDLFAVTLVRPGTYEVRDESSTASAEVYIWIPKGERIRTEHVELLRLGEAGFEPDSLRLHAGQSIIIECGHDARVVVELRDPEKTAGATRPESGSRSNTSKASGETSGGESGSESRRCTVRRRGHTR